MMSQSHPMTSCTRTMTPPPTPIRTNTMHYFKNED